MARVHMAHSTGFASGVVDVRGAGLGEVFVRERTFGLAGFRGPFSTVFGRVPKRLRARRCAACTASGVCRREQKSRLPDGRARRSCFARDGGTRYARRRVEGGRAFLVRGGLRLTAKASGRARTPGWERPQAGGGGLGARRGAFFPSSRPRGSGGVRGGLRGLSAMAADQPARERSPSPSFRIAPRNGQDPASGPFCPVSEGAFLFG